MVTETWRPLTEAEYAAADVYMRAHKNGCTDVILKQLHGSNRIRHVANQGWEMLVLRIAPTPDPRPRSREHG